jgi:ABC-2 type transport system ATP-binding protein
VLANVARGEAPALIKALVEAGIEIDEARWVGADLESVFMTETGHQETPHAG